jgi:hypothetical protein
MVGIYASSMPAEQLERNGIDPTELKPIIDAIAAGDLAKGIELTSYNWPSGCRGPARRRSARRRSAPKSPPLG